MNFLFKVGGIGIFGYGGQVEFSTGEVEGAKEKELTGAVAKDNATSGIVACACQVVLKKLMIPAVVVLVAPVLGEQRLTFCPPQLPPPKPPQ